MNRLTFSGHCGSDMEVRHTPSGTAIGAVNVPCESGWGDNKKTTWIRCKIFGERAEKLAPYIKKGNLVTISGRFEMDEWEKDGVKHSRPVCVIDDIVFSSKASEPTKPAPSVGGDDFEDSIPF